MRAASAGERQCYITIQRATFTQDELGQKTPSWVNVCAVYAKIEPVSAKEFERASSFAASVSHKLTIHYRTDIKVNYRVVYGSRNFIINGIVNVMEQDADLLLYATEEVTP